MDAGAGPIYTTYKYDGKKYKEPDCWHEEVDSKGHTTRKNVTVQLPDYRAGFEKGE
jgi:hypothetical protein